MKSFKSLRCSLGKTIYDVSQETGISEKYLYGLEEGRRTLTDIDIKKLSQCYDVSCEKIKELGNKNKNDTHSLINAIERFGYFPNLENINEEYLDAFVYLINDMWRDLNTELKQDLHKEEVVELFKKELLKKSIMVTNEFRNPSSFLYTYCGENHVSCWVDTYNYNENKECLIVFRYMNGYFIENLSQDDLANLIGEIKKYAGIHNEKIRIFYYNMNAKKSTYDEFSIDGKKISSNVEFPSDINKKKIQRIYRRNIRAKDLPNANFSSEEDCRCKGDKKGNCPMQTNNIPDESNGCSYCRGMAETWSVREWLLTKLSDNELKNYSNLYDFKNNYPEIYKELKYHFKNIESIYEYVYLFGSYKLKYTEHLYIEGNRYTNGRHRTKIAKNMDITIPVFWVTYEKMDEELIE